MQISNIKDPVVRGNAANIRSETGSKLSAQSEEDASLVSTFIYASWF